MVAVRHDECIVMKFDESTFGERPRDHDPKEVAKLAAEGDLERGIRKKILDSMGEKTGTLMDRVENAANELKEATRKEARGERDAAGHVMDITEAIKRAAEGQGQKGIERSND